jgi:hypothetical protein
MKQVLDHARESGTSPFGLGLLALGLQMEQAQYRGVKEDTSLFTSVSPSAEGQ